MLAVGQLEALTFCILAVLPASETSCNHCLRSGRQNRCMELRGADAHAGARAQGHSGGARCKLLGLL